MTLFLLAHLFTDFIFQTDEGVKNRYEAPLQGNLRHLIHMLILFTVFGVAYLFLIESPTQDTAVSVLIFILLNGAAHFITDTLKVMATKRISVDSVWLLLADQALHVLVIYGTYKMLLHPYTISSVPLRYIHLLLFLGLATFVSGVIIRHILRYFHLTSKETPSLRSADGTDSMNYGRWIGIIERSIMFLALFFNLLGLLTVVIAFKTVSRYQKFKENSEYYIIGNLLSILFVLVFYGLFRVMA